MGRNKLTIEEMQEIAKSLGGKCLSKKYVSGKSKLEWECAEEHRWNAKPTYVKGGTWCPICAKASAGESQRLTIKDMQEIAKKRGGKCLSKKYVNSKTKLQWECAEGHKWKAEQYSVRSMGTWCPECARKRK